MEILEESINEKGAELIFDDLPDVNVIGSQMRHLFQNLIGNALKFSEKDVKPRIHITHGYVKKDVEAAGNGFAERYLLLKINDNGIGFKQDHSQKIFDLFTRLHPRNLYEGTGLGLSIAKHIVEAHRGHLWVESEVGHGSRFSFSISLAA